MGLIKPAEGLQKFTLTCGFWRSPKWTRVSVGAIGLQAAGISYSYEHATDGRLPCDLEDLAVALGLRVSQIGEPLAELIGRGIWKESETHYIITDYAQHNPTRDEVRAYRERRREASLKANHARWHKPEEPDPDCPLCSEGVSQSVSDSESESDPPRNPTNVRTYGRTDVPSSSSPPPEDDGGRKDDVKAVDALFERFWEKYPRQPNGKKPDKPKALEQWKRLKPVERERALRGVGHYRDDSERTDTIPKHAHRWLRDRSFDDWQEPSTPPSRNGQTRSGQPPELCADHGVPARDCVLCRERAGA